MYELVIIGAGPAGMTAAVYAARKRISTLLLSKDFGGQPITTMGIENYMGYQYIEGPELMHKFEEQVKQFPLEQKIGQEVVALSRIDTGFEVETDKGESYQAKTVIIATGKRPRPLNVPGEEELRGRGVTYCAICDGPLFGGEKVAIVESCMDEVGGRTRLIANAGCPSTYETVLLAKEFARLGVEAVAVITPYFISCTQEGLAHHYSRIADSVSIPVYNYEIPARTGNSVDVQTVARLAGHGNIRGIKDSSGKTERLDALAVVAAEHEDFEFFSGTDSLILYGFRQGAAGCVSGMANVVPTWIRSVAEAFERGDEAGATEAQRRVNQLREALYAPGYPPAMVKRALYLLDPTVGNNRLPALVPTREVDAALSDVIEQFGIKHRMNA